MIHQGYADLVSQAFGAPPAGLRVGERGGQQFAIAPRGRRQAITGAIVRGLPPESKRLTVAGDPSLEASDDIAPVEPASESMLDGINWKWIAAGAVIGYLLLRK